MSMDFIIILPLVFGFGLLYWANGITNEDNILKHFFRLMFFPLMLLSLHFAIIDATLTYASDPALVELISLSVSILGYMIFIIGVYYAFYVLGRVKDFITQKKADNEEGKYD